MSTQTLVQYSVRELSRETWPDFEKLFSLKGKVGDGWDCWCMHHQRPSAQVNESLRTRAERAVRNHKEKKQLVEQDHAHGILVYANNEPVGWCQYGPKHELPRRDNSRNYRKLKLEHDKLWRITCFVVHKDYRGQGVASTGLKAALDSIKKKGGGLVEAYPVSKTDQGSNYLYSGTVSMFEKFGFKTVAPLSNGRTSTVVMQKTL
jgi:ribosomal protein S18 acetylase RimI-like enzyme